MMIIRRGKFLKVLFGVAIGVIFSIAVVAPKVIIDDTKVIKKVSTTHKVVSL